MRQNTDRRGGECNNVTAYTYDAGRVFYALSAAPSCRLKVRRRRSAVGASLSEKSTNQAVSSYKIPLAIFKF